ncbi:hypothetical protein CCUS01_01465 [Colletotrichum cuscutae]|uniref:Uncharacterized protein n=1 Tax=Colletotrichum cuscutae TaxID=1209917 RepID=A0AAI9XSZ1_9PEZI|nr:hypothetical protein CCUS01_01465 [Colletotrichum cuscutae]
MAVNNDDVLAANENINDNSSLSHQSLASSTRSVASSILEYRIENGRTITLKTRVQSTQRR